MGEAGYKRLIAWQKADRLAKTVYLATRKFPKEELYGITSQIRQSALSVQTNIVEGSARRGKRELKQFLSVALGSLAETEYLLDFSFDLRFLESEDYENLQGLRQETGNLLWRFFNSI